MCEAKIRSAEIRLNLIRDYILNFCEVLERCSSEPVLFLDAMHFLNLIYDQLDEYIKEVYINA